MTTVLSPPGRLRLEEDGGAYFGVDVEDPNILCGVGPDLQYIALEVEQLRAHYYWPPSRNQMTIAERFRELAERWKNDTATSSLISEIAMHPAYQAIIGFGQEALPYILKDLQESPSHWFWALKVITGIDPVPPEDRGHIQRMTNAWLKWGKRQGLIG